LLRRGLMPRSKFSEIRQEINGGTWLTKHSVVLETLSYSIQPPVTALAGCRPTGPVPRLPGLSEFKMAWDMPVLKLLSPILIDSEGFEPGVVLKCGKLSSLVLSCLVTALASSETYSAYVTFPDEKCWWDPGLWLINMSWLTAVLWFWGLGFFCWH